MALKRRIATLDGLSDEVKALYKQDGEVFVLEVEGNDDIDALQKKMDALLTEKKAEQDKRKQAEKDANDATEAKRLAAEKAALEKKDFESLYNSALEKITTLETKAKEQAALATSEKIEAEALKIATKAGAEGSNVALLARFVRDRLKPDQDGNIKVTDENGNLVMNSFDELAEQFKGGADYAALITGSKGSGGGAGGEGSGAGGAKKLSDMGDKERSDLYKSNPEQFKQLVSESKNAA